VRAIRSAKLQRGGPSRPRRPPRLITPSCRAASSLRSLLG
jgi:hypothetical protein